MRSRVQSWARWYPTNVGLDLGLSPIFHACRRRKFEIYWLKDVKIPLTILLSLKYNVLFIILILGC